MKTQITVYPRHIEVDYGEDKTITGNSILLINRRQLVRVRLDKDGAFFELAFALGDATHYLKLSVVKATGVPNVASIREYGKILDPSEMDTNVKAARKFAEWML